MKTLSVRIDVPLDKIKQMDEIKNKERWSRRQVLKVALENYLKLRGYREQDDNSSK